MSGPRLIMVVTGMRQLTPDIREFLMSSPDRSPLPRYEAGAHIELRLETTTGPVIRHYSLIGGQGTWDDPSHTYRIAVRRGSGQGSNLIHDTFGLGTFLEVSIPRNHFPLERTDGHTLLIAGGIGITPVHAMLRSLVRRKKPFSLVYVGRTRADMAYREDVQRLAGRHGELVLSGGASGRRPDFADLFGRQPAGTTAYVCGPSAMIASANRAAASLGWSAERVRSEVFAAGPVGEIREFDVELRRSGRVVRVGRDTTILNALESAGISMLADCRRGECGLCPVPVVAADGPIQHADRYLSEAERAGGKKLCICVSRVDGTRLVLDA